MEQFTEEDLFNIPAKYLNRRDRRRRRIALRKHKELAAKERKARTYKRACAGFARDGRPCAANPVKGAKHCRMHLNDAEKAKLGKTDLAKVLQESKRVRPPKDTKNVPSLMKTAVEMAVEKLIARYFAALGMELVGFDEEGSPIIIDHGMKEGITLHGESKEGTIVMTDYPDLMAQIQVMEKLIDRTYGKPKQTNVIEGGERPVKVQPVRSAERSQEVANLLQRVGAVTSRPTTELPAAPASTQNPPEDVIEGKVVSIKKKKPKEQADS